MSAAKVNVLTSSVQVHFLLGFCSVGPATLLPLFVVSRHTQSSLGSFPVRRVKVVIVEQRKDKSICIPMNLC